jgi:hypothetical protein
MADFLINGDARVSGSLTVSGDVKPLRARASILTQEPLKAYPLDLTLGRVHDAPQTLIGTPGNDDLGLDGTTFGTDSVFVTTGDVKGVTTTRRARYQFTLPPEYEEAEDVKIRVSAGMKTTVSDTTATVDIEVHKVAGDRTVGTDLCATAAQSINSLTMADKDFTITAATLSPGDQLDIRVTIAVTDGSAGTAVIGTIGELSPLLDIRG